MATSLSLEWSVRAFCLLLVVLCAGALWAGAAKPAAKPLCYVAPNGNDQWSGNLAAPNKARTDGPLATFAAAQQKVRAARQADPNRPLTVLFRGGVSAKRMYRTGISYAEWSALDLWPSDHAGVVATLSVYAMPKLSTGLLNQVMTQIASYTANCSLTHVNWAYSALLFSSIPL